VILTGLLIGGSVYLDRKGVPVTGRVTGRQERVFVGREPSGDWRRSYASGSRSLARWRGSRTGGTAAQRDRPTARRDDVMHALVLAMFPALVAWTGAPPCPAPADIQKTIGFPVMPRTQMADHCMYELTGQYRGAFVTLHYQPATRAPDLYADIRQRVKGILGANAKPDPLTLGEGGLAYSSMGKKEAAAVSKGQLYHVEMDYDLFENLKVRDDAAVRVVELAMGAAPASTAAAAPFDACMLATNAEVGEIAGAKPEMVKFYDAPTASFGGTHCDYGDGSIRVYQGKAPAEALEATLKAYKADKQPRVPVGGIGDKAFFMIPKPDDKYNRLGLLAVTAGPRVVQLTLDANGDEPIEATKPRLEKLAKLVLPRLK
jgi:hypothetical protein